MEEKKLDRNQIIGFLMIGAIMLWFAWWSSSNAPETVEPAEQTKEETVETVQPISSIEQPISKENDVVVPAEDSASDHTVAEITDSIFWLENQLIRIGITNKGAQIVKAHLKGFKTWDSLPLNIVDSNQILAFRLGDKNTSAALMYNGVLSNNNKTLTLSGKGNNYGGEFEITYALPDSSYQLQINASGKGFTTKEDKVYIDWQLDAFRTEKSVKTERQKATVYYWNEDDSHSLSVRGDDDEEEPKVSWLAYKQHFFSSILEPQVPFENSKIVIKEFTGEEYTKSMRSENYINATDGSFNLPLSLYYGPNKYKLLKTYGNNYQDVVDFGWGIFGWIGRGVVIPIFNWLEQYGINYGIIILIMALIIKLVLFPLTYTSYKSMAKMRVLKPEIDEINKKFEGKDAVKKNQAVMELYSQAGVNPLGGCIPMLVQMPILLAMFNFFPASIELRQQSFLWADDLSSYDSIISWQAQIPIISEFYGNHISLFTVLMTISTLIYTYMNSQMQGNSNQIPGMKYIMYGMPVMLLFWFNSYSAGLSYYYLLANVITFSQQFLIRRTLDDDAIHAKLQAKRASPKKKSKFQQRLAEMQKQQKKK